MGDQRGMPRVAGERIRKPSIADIHALCMKQRDIDAENALTVLLTIANAQPLLVGDQRKDMENVAGVLSDYLTDQRRRRSWETP